MRRILGTCAATLICFHYGSSTSQPSPNHSDIAADVSETVAGPIWQGKLRAHLDKLGQADLDMIAALPDVLPQMLSNTRFAFRASGWPVAQRVFYDVERSQLRSWASDKSMFACDTAWIELYKMLRIEPDQCRRAIAVGWDAVTTPVAAEAVNRVKSICGAATENGFNNRKAGRRSPTMTDANWLAFLKQSFERPEPLSEAERYAIDNAKTAEPTLVCESKLKLQRNLLAQGKETLGAFHRTSYRFAERDDEIAKENASTRSWPKAPDDFTCPAPGTRFLLSTRRQDGKNVVHTALARGDFDCLIVSSFSGERNLLNSSNSANPARPANNWVRSLWPLAVGKSAHYSYHPAFGDQTEEDDRVTAVRPISFARGRVEAFEITQDVSINGGELIYRFVDYWSTDVSYLVGHRTIPIRGTIRQANAPDWRVLEIYPPGDNTKL